MRRLEGGYKAFRQRVMDDLEHLPACLDFPHPGGPTGKTALLEALAEAGCGPQALAHRGSVLGVAESQPGQKAFETGCGAPCAAWSRQAGVGRVGEPAYRSAARAPCSENACVMASACASEASSMHRSPA